MREAALQAMRPGYIKAAFQGGNPPPEAHRYHLSLSVAVSWRPR